MVPKAAVGHPNIWLYNVKVEQSTCICSFTEQQCLLRLYDGRPSRFGKACWKNFFRAASSPWIQSEWSSRRLARLFKDPSKVVIVVEIFQATSWWKIFRGKPGLFQKRSLLLLPINPTNVLSCHLAEVVPAAQSLTTETGLPGL